MHDWYATKPHIFILTGDMMACPFSFFEEE